MLSLSLSGLAKHLNWTLDGRVEDVHVLRPLATEHLARPHLHIKASVQGHASVGLAVHAGRVLAAELK